MSSLIQKLVYTGYARPAILNFSIQEMILPQTDGVTRIIYEWNQYFRDGEGLGTDEYLPFLQLLCSINDPNQNIHFITQGKLLGNLDAANLDIYSNKDIHDVMFISAEDICLTFGRFRFNDNAANPGIIPNGFNRPLAFNDLNTINRTGIRTNVPGAPRYNYSTADTDLPVPQLKDVVGYDNNPAVTNNGAYTAVVKYIEIDLPINEVRDLILTL